MTPATVRGRPHADERTLQRVRDRRLHRHHSAIWLLTGRSVLVPGLRVGRAGVHVLAADDQRVRVAGGVGEVGRRVVVEVIAAGGLGNGVSAGCAEKATDGAIDVDASNTPVRWRLSRRRYTGRRSPGSSRRPAAS